MLGTNVEKHRITSLEKAVHFKYYFIILTLFTASWLTAGIAAVKLISIWGVTLTGGFIIFPLTTMLSTVIVEVYGYKNARQAIWSGFILNLFFLISINVVNIIPSSPYWGLEKQFTSILVPETRIIFASLISFLISDFVNSYLMAKMKLRSLGKSLIRRIFVSLSLSVTIDIIFFMLLAFSGTLSTQVLGKLILAAYCKRLMSQVLLLPLAWCIIELLKGAEGVEVYDRDTLFNPFSMDNIYKLNSASKPISEVNTSGLSQITLSNIQH